MNLTPERLDALMLQWAATLGAHWGWLFVGLWAALLVLIAAFVFGTGAALRAGDRRYPQVRRAALWLHGQTRDLTARGRVPGWVFSRMLLMLALAAAGLVLAGKFIGELAERIGPEGRIARLDEAFTFAAAAHTSPTELTAFALVSHAGDGAWLFVLALAVGAVLWWRQHRLLAVAWLVALALNGLLTRALKVLLERVRPEHLHDLAVIDNYSFPSGHSSGAVVAYGWLALMAIWLLPTRWRWAAAAGFITLAWSICFSRLVLQVHYPSDVLAGMASGLAWLAASALAVRALGHTGRPATRRLAPAMPSAQAERRRGAWSPTRSASRPESSS